MPFLAPIIEALLAGLLWLFKSRIGTIILSVLVWLGLNWVTLDVVLDPTINALRSLLSNVGSGTGDFIGAARAWLGVLQFDKALTMIISAYVTRAAVSKGKAFLVKAATT